MPHAKHLRKFFGRKWREHTRPRIIARALAEYGVDVSFWLIGLLPAFVPCERCHTWVPYSEIQVAHLYLAPGVPGHDDDENLAALCSTCHRQHDYAAWAWDSYETRCKRKDAGRPLLQLTEAV
jgi:hypothetical protein